MLWHLLNKFFLLRLIQVEVVLWFNTGGLKDTKWESLCNICWLTVCRARGRRRSSSCAESSHARYIQAQADPEEPRWGPCSVWIGGDVQWKHVFRGTISQQFKLVHQSVASSLDSRSSFSRYVVWPLMGKVMHVQM